MSKTKLSGMLVKFLLKRFTDYYNIVEENKKLNHDIDILIFEPNTTEALTIKGKYCLMRSITGEIRGLNLEQSFDWIWSQIKNE